MPEPEFDQRLRATRQRFCELYGAGQAHALLAPARLNILGEHVDYVSYLPAASLTFGSQQHSMLLLYRPTANAEVRCASTNAAYEPFGFALSEDVATARDWEAFVFSRPTPAPHWSNYVKGAVYFAQWRYGARVKRGFDFLVDSTILACGGSSSSSALTCLAGAAIRASNEIVTPREALALESAQAEWFVGTRGGALDHLTICAARRGCASLINHQTQTIKYVRLPACAWVTFFSHAADKGREAMLAYNERAAVARLLIPAIIAAAGWSQTELLAKLEALPEQLTLAEIARLYPAAYRQCERAFPALARLPADTPLQIRKRALHHRGEIERVARAVELLEAEDAQTAMVELGRLLNASHASLRELYEVSTPEVEALRDCLLASADVYGARLIGGGFGGNVLALTRAECVESLIEAVQRVYYAPRQRDCRREGAVMVSLPGDGLLIPVEEA
jgi:galactokinase